jgi:hypothetical protein
MPEPVLAVQAKSRFFSKLSQGILTRLQQSTLPPKWEWFTGLTCLFTLLFWVLIPMLPVELPNLWGFVLPASFSFGWDVLCPKTISYTFQWWVMALIFAWYGIRLASFIMGLLLFTSLFLSVFAEGGGLSIWLTPSMPYAFSGILAFMVVAQKWQFLLKYIYGRAYKPSFRSNESGRNEPFVQSPSLLHKRSPLRLFFNSLILALWSVLFLHCVGCLGILALVLLKQYSYYEALQWGLHHTLYPLPYDFIGVALMLNLTRYGRLWMRPLLYGRLSQRLKTVELV